MSISLENWRSGELPRIPGYPLEANNVAPENRPSRKEMNHLPTSNHQFSRDILVSRRVHQFHSISDWTSKGHSKPAPLPALLFSGIQDLVRWSPWRYQRQSFRRLNFCRWVNFKEWKPETGMTAYVDSINSSWFYVMLHTKSNTSVYDSQCLCVLIFVDLGIYREPLEIKSQPSKKEIFEVKENPSPSRLAIKH